MGNALSDSGGSMKPIPDEVVKKHMRNYDDMQLQNNQLRHDKATAQQQVQRLQKENQDLQRQLHELQRQANARELQADATQLAVTTGAQELTEGFPLVRELVRRWETWVDEAIEPILVAVEKNDNSQAAAVRNWLVEAWQNATAHVEEQRAKLADILHEPRDGPSRALLHRVLRMTHARWARRDATVEPASQLERLCRQELHPLLVAFLLSEPPLHFDYAGDLDPLDKPPDAAQRSEVLILPAIAHDGQRLCKARSVFLPSSAS